MADAWWRRDRVDRLKSILCSEVDWRAIYRDRFEWDGTNNFSCYKAEDHDGGEDKRPSMAVLDDNGAVFCHTCGAKASTFIGALEDSTGEDFETVCQVLYHEHVEPLISPGIVEALNKRLCSDKTILAKVKERMKLTDGQIKEYKLGWSERKKRLTIPIQNEFGWVVDIRCYDVFKLSEKGFKVVSWKKGFGGARVWPFTRKRKIVVVEGEKDKMAGRSIGLPAVTITSGGRSIPERLLKYFEDKEVYIAQDNDKTGQEGAIRRAKEIGKVARLVKIVNLDVKKPKEDMWDWVFKYGGTEERFWALAADAEDAPTMASRLTEGEMQREIRSALSDEEDGPVRKAINVFEVLERGGWFYRTQLGTFFATDLRCVPVSKRDQDFLSFCIKMSPMLNKEIMLGKVIMSHLEAAAGNVALRATISNQFYYDKDRGRLLVKDDEDSQLLTQLSAEGLTKVQNGCNESNVLLAFSDHALRGFKMGKTIDWREEIKWLWREVFEFMPISPAHRLIVLSWFAASFFKQLTPDRPMLRFLAPSASGKSHILRLLSHLLYGGEYVDGPNATVASLASSAVKRPMLLVDNIEMEHVMGREGLNDLFIALATNVSKEKRRVGTDTDTIIEKPECVTATTGIEPFAKSEIVNRFLYVDVDRKRHGRPDYLDFERFEAIGARRDQVLHGLLEACRTQIAAVRSSLTPVARRYALEHSQYIRFPVYMAVMEVLGSAFADVLGLDYQSAVNEAMAFQGDQLSTYGVGGNPVVTWLETWWVRTQGSTVFESSYRPIVRDDGSTFMWYLTPTELFNELSTVARAVNRRIPWLNPQQLSYRIKDAEHALTETGWEVAKFRSGGQTQFKLTKRGSLPSFSQAAKDAEMCAEIKSRKFKLKGRR